MVTWLRKHLRFYRSAYGNYHFRLSLGRRFVYVAWGSDKVDSELEEVETSQWTRDETAYFDEGLQKLLDEEERPL